jgi:hypothetical protein
MRSVRGMGAVSVCACMRLWARGCMYVRARARVRVSERACACVSVHVCVRRERTGACARACARMACASARV